MCIVDLMPMSQEGLKSCKGIIEKDCILDHATRGIFNGAPFVCSIQGCGGDGYSIYPQGVLCRKHEEDAMRLLRGKK